MKNFLMSGGIILGALILILLFASLRIVNPGERGVEVTLGVVSEDILAEGIHLRMPFIQRIVNVDVKTQKVEYSSNSASRDLQSVTTVVAINFFPDPEDVNNLYREIGLNYETKIIKPAIEEAVKASTAQFTAEELITKRREVKDTITEILNSRLSETYIVVDEVSIVDFSFSPEFDKAIEEKQTAEQQALREKWELERVKIQAQQKIEQAKAEAEALRLQKQELTPELLQLRAIEKWNGVMPKVTGGATPFVTIE